jgi:hypothetical protein
VRYQMRLIRKLIAMGPAAAGLIVAIAFALAPVSVQAEGSHSSKTHQKTAAVQTFQAFTPAASAPTFACTNERQKLATARADDRVSDAAEKLALKAATLTPAGKKALDVAEKAAMKTQRDAVHTACVGQPKAAPTTACLAAKQALKDAVKHKDSAPTLKTLRDVARAACIK